jgi:hypothetical protein
MIISSQDPIAPRSVSPRIILATQACDQCFGHAMAPVPLFVGEQGQSQDLLVDVIGTPTMNLELNLPPPKTA